MDFSRSILKDVRLGLGLDENATDFDTDLLLLINSAIAEVNQNGVGKHTLVTDDTTTWLNLQDPLQVEGNRYFGLVPLFITLSAKLIFDPPPPSSADYHAQHVRQLLWRLKIAYEVPLLE